MSMSSNSAASVSIHEQPSQLSLLTPAEHPFTALSILLPPSQTSTNPQPDFLATYFTKMIDALHLNSLNYSPLSLKFPCFSLFSLFILIQPKVSSKANFFLRVLSHSFLPQVLTLWIIASLHIIHLYLKHLPSLI